MRPWRAPRPPAQAADLLNLSGQSVTEAMRFYKFRPSGSLSCWTISPSPPAGCASAARGATAGKNGMKNIIYLSGKDTFPRVKLGIGSKPNPEWNLADWVLSTFSAEEQKLLSEAAGHAADAVELYGRGQNRRTMNRFNS